MSNQIEIVPAILPKDFAELAEKVGRVSGLVKTVQVDVCDGHFVPSFTWPYKKKDDTFQKMLREEEGLPEWKRIEYEFDLMVDDPEELVNDWVQIGAARIIIHAEAKGDVAGAIKNVSGRVEIGLALNIETPISVIDSYYSNSGENNLIQLVQCMGINRIGYQGQEFDHKVVEKIKEIKVAYPNLPISVDGGVSLETAPELIVAGASRLVVGSVIFDSENVNEAISKLKSLR